MNFTESGLKVKYENKKNNAKRRNIDFNLTEKEFYSLCLYLKDNPYCSYTNKKFVFSTGSSYYPTLERVDSTHGYEIGNCIWVSLKSNQIKSKWEDFKAKQLTFTKEEFDVVQMILGNQSNIKEQLNKIQLFVNGEGMETTVTTLVKTKEENEKSEANGQIDNPTSTFATNNDVQLAQSYSQFYEYYANKSDFLLSFNQYKKLLTKKQCQLSSIKFDDLNKPSLFILDKTKSVEVNNILVVNAKIRQQLDNFVGKVKLDNKQLKKVFTNLGKVL